MDSPFPDDQISGALNEAGVPSQLHPEFIAFQKKHGGRQDAFGQNTLVWGILHRAPKWLEVAKIEAEPDDETAGMWHVFCADVHPSDMMTIDQYGRLYWCYDLRYQHYDQYFDGQPPLDWSRSRT